MVCKDEVLSWFKDLDCHIRIDVLYELLNMCLPFEIRFMGLRIEELGKHTYQEFRGATLIANDLEKLSKDTSFNQGIFNEVVRSRVLIYLPLLSSRNYSVASWLYRKLLRTDLFEEYLMKDKGVDEQLNSEFLLLFTMALHHPAFCLEHKLFFSRVLVSLINIRENRISSKHTALGFPPGFGYPTQKPPEGQRIPVKMAAPASCGDSSTVFHQPPGLHHLPFPPHFDFMVPFWSRPGIPYGAPEVPPFPAPSISPLVSQAPSPCQSRSTSPHRTNMLRLPTSSQSVLQPAFNVPPPSIPPSLREASPSNVDILPVPMAPHQLILEQLPQGVTSLPKFNSTPEDDPARTSLGGQNHLPDRLWSLPGQPNGIRFPAFISKVRPYIAEQMQALNQEGENSLHRSNSSSASSRNSTPPGTPSIASVGPPQAPGREERNPGGNPIPVGAGPGTHIPDTTSPPPPFSNSSVPYSHPQPFATVPPNRSMFHYNPAYRPTFTAQYSSFPTDTNFPPNTFPHFHLMYSSPYHPRTTPPGCFNCGAPNHVGSECTSQNIEDITQKKTYQLEYTTPLPDSEKR